MYIYIYFFTGSSFNNADQATATLSVLTAERRKRGGGGGGVSVQLVTTFCGAIAQLGPRPPHC